MGIHIGIEHRTTYEFDRLTTIHPHVLRLRPAPHSRTPILSYSLRVEPENHFINWQQDPFGNFMARLVFPEPSRVLDFTVDLVADLTVVNPFDFFVEESAEFFPFEYEPLVRADLEPYLRPASDDTKTFDKWLTGIEHRDGTTRIADFLVAKRMDRAQFEQKFVRFQVAHQRLVMKALDLRDPAEVTPELQRLWLEEARGRHRVVVDEVSCEIAGEAVLVDAVVGDLDRVRMDRGIERIGA